MHIPFAEPICSNLKKLASSLKKLKVKFHDGGTYVCIEGLQFSSFASQNYTDHGDAEDCMTILRLNSRWKQDLLCKCFYVQITIAGTQP